MLKQITDRLFYSWKTTLVGSGVFAFLFYLGHGGHVEWLKLWPWMGGAGFVLFLKDPQGKENGPGEDTPNEHEEPGT